MFPWKSKRHSQPYAPQPQYGAPQQPYGAPRPQYGAPQPQYAAPQPQYGAPQYGAPQHGAPQYGAPAGPATSSGAGTIPLEAKQKYGLIPDNFTSVKQVQDKLREVGLESSNLIVGIDFTKSNEWTGKHSFNRQCLHAVGQYRNPYESALAIVGETLAAFDEDGLIPCFGFGDVSTHDSAVFSFNADGRPCQGFPEALQRYRQIAPHVRLSGPTSFAPIVEQAIRIVEQSGGQYHTLVIIADGQVTRSADLRPHELSPQEQATVTAIAAASNYPLSIILVGVGDGPWGQTTAFDNSIPQRNFDNFQFVNFTEIMGSSYGNPEHTAARFALMALMEVPFQFKACGELRLVGRPTGRMPPTPARPPPPEVLAADAQSAGKGQGYQQAQGGMPYYS